MKSAIVCLLALVVTLHVSATYSTEQRVDAAQGKKKDGKKKDGKKRGRKKGGRKKAARGGQGQVSPQQVRQRLLRRFDANSNGAIDGAELNQLAIAVHQMMQRGQRGRGQGGRGKDGPRGPGEKKKKRR